MNLLQMSFSGAVFIIAVVLLRAAAVYKLPKKTFPVLWEMVFLRLLIPFSIPFIFSIYTLINNHIAAPALFQTETGSSVPVIPQEQFFTQSGMEQLSASTPSPVSVRLVVCSAVWCAGVIILTTFFAISWLRCQIAFQTAFPVHHTFAEQWLKECPSKRQISIKQSDRISSPLTYGIFRPVILMPKNTDWKDESQLQYIFAHEYVHIRRFDAFTKLIAALVLCIHWFNPLVWIMYILFNRDIELACDESVAILHYEDGAPYLHDILTNNTDKTIVETEYCMSAYDENGSPLELYWNFLDSSAECSYENLVRTEGNILPHQTKDYRGGWSLYDGEIMDDMPKAGNGGANQVAYSLFCLKQVVFEDGTVWNNPEYENWFKTYVGKEIVVDTLKSYYPYKYKLE